MNDKQQTTKNDQRTINNEQQTTTNKQQETTNDGIMNYKQQTRNNNIKQQ